MRDFLTHASATRVAASNLPGDYNGDGSVDAADYVLWRKGLGTSYTQDDYNTWRAHFGATLGNGSSSAFHLPPSPWHNAVPEPMACLLLVLGLGGLITSRRLVANTYSG